MAQVIRAAAPSDQEQIGLLAPRLLHGVAGWRDPAAVEQKVRECVERAFEGLGEADRAVLVATVGEVVVGFITVVDQAHWTGALDAYIGELVVAPTPKAEASNGASGRAWSGYRCRPAPVIPQRDSSTSRSGSRRKTSRSAWRLGRTRPFRSPFERRQRRSVSNDSILASAIRSLRRGHAPRARRLIARRRDGPVRRVTRVLGARMGAPTGSGLGWVGALVGTAEAASSGWRAGVELVA